MVLTTSRQGMGAGSMIALVLLGTCAVMVVSSLSDSTSEPVAAPTEPAPVAVRSEPQPTVALTGCDMERADRPAEMAAAAVGRINLWATAEGGRVVGNARGTDASAARGTPAWCVGELVTVLERATDSNGRRRVRVQTAGGITGWVTDFFLLE